MDEDVKSVTIMDAPSWPLCKAAREEHARLLNTYREVTPEVLLAAKERIRLENICLQEIGK